MTRFAPVLLGLLLILSACGVSRDAAEGAQSEPDEETSAEEADSQEDDTTTSSAPAPNVIPTTAPDGDVAMTVEFPDETWELSHGDLNALLVPTWENEEFVTLAFGGAVPTGFQTGVAFESLIGRILDRELDAVGGTLDPEDEEAARTSLFGLVESWFAASDDPAAEAERLYGEVPYLPFIVNQQAKQQAIGDALAEEGGLTVEVPCVRHILLEEEAAADEVLQLLTDGGDFAELAAERSTGPTGPSGGDLGCSPSANYVPEFAAAVDSATIGEYVGPVQTQFGWHVLVVERYEESVGDPTAAVNDRIRQALESAQVEVDPRIGEWDADNLTVVPPQTTE